MDKIDQEKHQKIKVIKVTKEYFETEDEKVWFDEPLEKEITVEEMITKISSDDWLRNGEI